MLRYSLVFQNVMRSSEIFSWVLSGSERLLKVLRCFQMLWDVLRVPKAFSWVLSGSERFLKLLRRSLAS